MLQNEGEKKAEVNFSTSGLELKGAYALTDNYVITAMISAGSGETDDDDRDTSVHRYLEGGFGHSIRLGRFFVFENIGGIGVGYGKGYGKLLFNDDTFMAEGTYMKPFLQNNMALQTNPFDLGLVNRMSIIQFGSIKSVYREDEKTIDSPSTPLYWEPTLFSQIGWDRVKISSQFGYSIPISGTPEFEWLWFHFGLGINYRFGN